MALVGQLLQGVLHAGAGAQVALLPDAQAGGDRVGGFEPDAPDVPRQPVRVLGEPARSTTILGLVLLLLGLALVAVRSTDAAPARREGLLMAYAAYGG